ncbi:SOS2 isoform 6 [Pongo abelii]|uniref:SOS2 isoform 6 n=1 Tax=Pongo abelii TaxID=9601 RepID=A0A2J8WKF1_PONAB|nr:SOS2 isoform 6 [Pongo abelii]
MQQAPQPYEFFSEENSPKWRGLLVSALRKKCKAWFSSIVLLMSYYSIYGFRNKCIPLSQLMKSLSIILKS